MNQGSWIAIIGAIFAGVIATIQAMQGARINDNHEMTHERIDDVEQTVVPRKEIDGRFMGKDKIIETQTRHSDQIADLEQDLRDYKDHSHD